MKPTFLILALCSYLISSCQAITISGNIINEDGAAVPGATITVKGTNKTTVADNSGKFTIHNSLLTDTLIISAIGYQTKEEPNNIRGLITVILTRKFTQLDQAVVIAYGSTTRRLNTGNISKLTAEEISNQPVSNPLAAMEGRVPGLLISQTGGSPGSSFKVELRGRTSLDASISGNDPLFIIDGIPFAPGNDVISQLRSSANNPRSASLGGLSPFALINPADIESIEVLKDADATAIYGSRGANGVILITTKKGKPGHTSVTANIYTGSSKITRTASMLNTQQYLQMRREAFANDGVTPTVSNAPDLLVWDTTRCTDFKKWFIGNTARSADFQLSVSGGTAATRFLIGGGYHKETTVYPGSFSDSRGSIHFSLDHISASKNFGISLSASYSSGRNNMLQTDLTTFLNLPPDFPALYDSAGNLKWSEKGISFSNPLAELLRTYIAKNDNLTSSLQFSYRILSSLFLKANAGYNLFQTDEMSLYPKASIDPASSSLAFSYFANSRQKSWIAEPQLEYSPQWRKNKMSFLLGATWQNVNSGSTYVDAENYTSDLLLSSIAAAPLVFGSNSFRQYRYNAVFGRLNWNHDNKYLLNISARRDASSRFGPGHRFGNFAAAGLAWIFSKEKEMQEKFPFLSFGKWRTSYGITGNDQVGDYRYLDSWQNSSLTYQGTTGLQPSRLFNPDYGWEVNRKFETALDLGFWRDRILLSAVYFINRSGNRLINYTLPVQTGFSSVLENWDAVVRNSGWEFSLSSVNIFSRNLKWSSTFILTIPKNKLVSFPGLSVSSYRNTYVAGYSLSVINFYKYLGVDPATGVYKFLDLDSNGTFNTSDYIIQGKTDPSFYGSLGNTLSWKNWQLDFFIEFRKQTGRNFLATQSTATPGRGLNNQPAFVLDHWQYPGDAAAFQRYTASTGTAAYTAGTVLLPASGALFTDASFVRIKNLSCAYNLPANLISKIKIHSCRLFLQAQNLFTITNYRGADPENQNLYVLPPLRTITAGVQLTF